MPTFAPASWSAAALCRFSLCSILFGSHLNVAAAETTAPNSTALEALERLKGIDLEANPAVKNAVLKILDQVKGTPQFVEIVRDFQITGQEPALLDFAAKQPSSSAAADATRMVLHGKNPNSIKDAL